MPQLPAASLELTDEVSDEDALQLRAYRELLFTRNELELDAWARFRLRLVPGPLGRQRQSRPRSRCTLPAVDGGEATRVARRFFNRDEQMRRMQVCSTTAELRLLVGVAGYWSTVLQRPVPADSAELVCALRWSSHVSSRSHRPSKADPRRKRPAKEAAAQEKLLQVFVSEPYLELSTGPGRGYPVFHVVEREESVDVLYPPHRLVQGARRARRRRLGPRARHAPHQARRRLAVRRSTSATAPASPRTTGKSASAAATTAAPT